MKEMKTLKFPNQDEPYEIVDAYAREQIANLPSVSYVDEKIADLVNSAPEKLNTLDELAAALGDDENFANTVTTELSKKVNTSDLTTETWTFTLADGSTVTKNVVMQ